MFRKPKIWIAAVAITLIATLVVTLLPVGIDVSTSGNVSITLGTYEILASPGEVTYYFDAYHPTEKWTTTPEYMVDDVLTNYASTTVNNQVERLTENTCPGNNLGTIAKVEIRAYAYGDSNDELYIRPEFAGGAGSNHITVPGETPGWGAYQNVTNDTNAPSPWTWTEVQGLECDIEYDKTGPGASMFVSKAEVKVTYSTGAPKGSSVAFVRATEGAIVDTGLTLNIQVSAGTDRVLVVGLAYKSSSVVVPTSIVFNTSENFSVVLSAADGGDAQCFLYYLAAPTETTANVVITMPGEVRMVGYVAYFTGVDQGIPFTAAMNEAQGVDNTPTVDVSSAADEIVIDIMAQVSAGPDTITSNSGTKICDGAATGGGSDTRGGGQYEVGQATRTMSYTMSDTDNWNIVAGALREPLADIDVGATPIDRTYEHVNLWTLVDKNNPANASGILHSVIVYASQNITGLIVGTFYTTNGNTLKCRDSEAIGAVEAGAERTFTELSIAVQEGDYIGCYFTGGYIERAYYDNAGIWRIEAEHIDPNDEAEYIFTADDAISLYGYGDIIVPDIDVGAPAIDRSSNWGQLYTYIDKNNPANASGILHTVKVWANSYMGSLRVGTFYTTNGNTLKCRDSEVIGAVDAGAERTFTELSITVVEGDYIGCYFTGGTIDMDTSGFTGVWNKSGEYIDPNDEAEYSFLEGNAISLTGYGNLGGEPTVTTQAATNIGTTSATLNGEITDIGVGNCDERGFESRHTPSVQTTLGVGNPHGIVYYDGFVYTCHREAPGKVVKTSVTNYASKSTLTPQHNSSDAAELTDIIYAAGYLWVCDYDGWVYKIDPASFTVSAAYQPVAAEADCLCSDGTYVYVGYDAGHIGKILISTGDTSSNDLGTQRWHGMVEDGDYLYLNNSFNYELHKIAKSSLTSVDSVVVGVCTDDIAQDSTYVYLGREYTATAAIIRVTKSNLSLSSQTPSGLGGSYGVFMVGSQIILLDAESNWIWVFESTLTSKKVILTGLNDASPINELAEDGDDNLHITQWKGTDAPLVKINKYVILDAFDWTETDSFGAEAFDHIIADLHPGVTYKYRAKAHNSGGWGYGNEVEFDTTADGADISNIPTSKDFGVVSTSATLWSNGSEPTWPLVDGDAYFTVTNNGGTCSITIVATNFTGGVGWTLAGTPAENTVTLVVFEEGDGSGDGLTLTTSPQAFIAGLAGSADKDWELKFLTATSHTDGAGKTSTLTLAATLD